jgi:hypothetical protein
MGLAANGQLHRWFRFPVPGSGSPTSSSSFMTSRRFVLSCSLSRPWVRRMPRANSGGSKKHPQE